MSKIIIIIYSLTFFYMGCKKGDNDVFLFKKCDKNDQTIRSKIIKVDNNKLYGNFKNFCKCHKNLRILRVALGDKEIKGLSYCESLTHLIIHGENLKKIDYKELPKSLTNLYLSYTKIEKFNNLKNMKNLKNVWIVTKGFQKRKQINIDGMKIVYLDPEIVTTGCIDFNLGEWYIKKNVYEQKLYQRRINNFNKRDKNLSDIEFKFSEDNILILFNTSTLSDSDKICDLFELIYQKNLIELIEIENISAIKYLLNNYFIEFNKMDEKSEKTPLDYAYELKNKEIIKLLRKHGAKRGCELLNKKCEREIE